MSKKCRLFILWKWYLYLFSIFCKKVWMKNKVCLRLPWDSSILLYRCEIMHLLLFLVTLFTEVKVLCRVCILSLFSIVTHWYSLVFFVACFVFFLLQVSSALSLIVCSHVLINSFLLKCQVEMNVLCLKYMNA